MDPGLETLTTWRSGRLGDLIHSRNPAGPYTRPFVTPTNPNTARQIRVRGRLRDVSQAWLGTLTQTQRDSWDTYAGRVRFQTRGPGPIHLSGQALFVRNNAGRTRPFMGIILDAPTAGTSGTLTRPTYTRILVPARIRVVFDTTAEWVAQDNAWLIVYASDARPFTHNFFAGPYRFAGTIPGNAATPPTSPQDLVDPFPSATAGRRWARHRIAYADGKLTHSIQTRLTEP